MEVIAFADTRDVLGRHHAMCNHDADAPDMSCGGMIETASRLLDCSTLTVWLSDAGGAGGIHHRFLT